MSWLTSWSGRRPRIAQASRRRSVAQLQVEAFEQRLAPTVTNFGGNLLSQVEAQALFLGSAWSAGAAAGQAATINSYLSDVTGGAYMDALTSAGYGVGRGTASAGYVDNSNIKAGSTITDSSIQAAIKADIVNGGLQAPDANRLYIVYVEPNVAVNLGAGQGTTQQGILGYHGAFAGPNGNTIRYAVIAYPGGSAANSSLGTTVVDQLTAVTSHELAEAVTDPDVNFARLGWYDKRRGEIGDITENNPNALVRLDGYLVQEVADQNDQLLAIASNVTPPANPPSNPPAGNPPTGNPPTGNPPTGNPPTGNPPTGTTTTTTTLTSGTVQYRKYGPPTVTLTVTIASSSGAAQLGGAVALVFDGSVIGVGRVHLVNGVATATFTVAFFSTGDFSFSAEYLGANQFQGSTSNSVTVTV